MKTYIINLISGPGSGKTTMAAMLFSELKMQGELVEYVQEFAKKLVWLKDFAKLNNQYLVSSKQSELFSKIEGNVKYIVTDACLLHGLYYNKHNPDNVSNVEKTEKLIIDSYAKFNNINIFLRRGSFPYETAGRIESEDTAKKVDQELLKHLLKMDIPFCSFSSNKEEIPNIIKYIKLMTRNEEKCFTCDAFFDKVQNDGFKNGNPCLNCFDELICDDCSKRDKFCQYCLKTDTKIKTNYQVCHECHNIVNKKELEIARGEWICHQCLISQGYDKCENCYDCFPGTMIKKCKIKDCKEKLCLQCYDNQEGFCGSCGEFGCQLCLTNVKDKYDSLFFCEKCNQNVCLDCTAVVYCQAIECYCCQCAKILTFKCEECSWTLSGPEYNQTYGSICIDSGDNPCPQCHRSEIDFETLKD